MSGGKEPRARINSFTTIAAPACVRSEWRLETPYWGWKQETAKRRNQTALTLYNLTKNIGETTTSQRQTKRSFNGSTNAPWLSTRPSRPTLAPLVKLKPLDKNNCQAQ
ncbi:MAG: hypothetical protein CM1200mP29_14840 [Verrucomicrobiota bacterium]|nr:MAG: hypothetical protein CM1200mP29_14840 [Verrucomicrobiota bacterium]